jgi:hypothetical protein
VTVLHLWHSRGWRGGENQFRLLASHLGEEWRGHLGAPAGSELAPAEGVLPVHPLACNGLFDPGSAIAARRLLARHGWAGLIHAHDAMPCRPRSSRISAPA